MSRHLIEGLLDSFNKKIMVLLSDNRTLFGILQTIDQKANLVLNRTVEKIYSGNKYAEIDLGTIIIRGENIVIIGETNLENDENSEKLEKVSMEEILSTNESSPDKLIVQKERKKIKELITFIDFYDPNHL